MNINFITKPIFKPFWFVVGKVVDVAMKVVRKANGENPNG